MEFEASALTVAPGATVNWASNDGSNPVVKFSDQHSPRLRIVADSRRRFDVADESHCEYAVHGKCMSSALTVR